MVAICAAGIFSRRIPQFNLVAQVPLRVYLGRRRIIVRSDRLYAFRAEVSARSPGPRTKVPFPHWRREGRKMGEFPLVKFHLIGWFIQPLDKSCPVV